MAHSFITTRMIRHPGAHVQDLVVYNYNCLAIGNLTLNLPTTEDSGLLLCLRVHICGVIAGEATQCLVVRFETWQKDEIDGGTSDHASNERVVGTIFHTKETQIQVREGEDRVIKSDHHR